MDIKLAKLLCEYGFELHENYSGRGMYGEKTAAVVVPNVLDVANVILANAGEFIDEEGYPLFNDEDLTYDNFGTDYIIY